MQGITKKEKGPGHLNLKASRRSRPDAASDDPETGGESPTIIARSAARARRNGEPCAVFFLRQPASFSSPPPWPGDPLKGPVNCAAVRSSCVAACNNRETTQAGIQACSNRCSIQFCRDTVIECRPGDQRVCNDDFSSCNGGCDALAAIPSAAAILKRLAPAAAAGSSRSVSASEPATQARSTANRQIGLDLCLERATSTA